MSLGEWPGSRWTDEAKTSLIQDRENFNQDSNEKLILKALSEIITEQYRAAGNGIGWPPLSNHALARVLAERAEETGG